MVADRLASSSDTVAAHLADGSGCAALKGAQKLRQAALGAIADGDVPSHLAPELRRRVRSLASAITCVETEPVVGQPGTPVPTATEDEEADDREEEGREENAGRGKRGRGKKHGKNEK